MKSTVAKQAETKAVWVMSICEMPTSEGYSYPVFQWSYVTTLLGLCGGELLAWLSAGGVLVFKDRRGNEPHICKTVECALSIISQYGWVEPPHIREVFQDLKEMQPKFIPENLKNTEEILQQLRERWGRLICTN
ncbi:MAG: hypothetical protein UY09_C0025G0021 [Parcubacteria group bacterium GW2011_GWA2_47_8]|nr:MAG: hypothetical protein UY09_C0025G0021 [Parcubacteria group bacterium GW2011_GWA2_47_8]OHB19322.1 MAG: hypothetical protein A2666_00740 [Parcubacteria group bacterium RIFCSPHIGHO2_01_FULL_47_10b]